MQRRIILNKINAIPSSKRNVGRLVGFRSINRYIAYCNNFSDSIISSKVFRRNYYESKSKKEDIKKYWTYEETKSQKVYPKRYVISYINFEALYYILNWEKGLGWTKKGARTSRKIRNLELFKDKAGIYMITNTITKKKYIGKSINLYLRINSYFQTNFVKDKSSLIYKALRKFGYNKFTFTILEYCDINNMNSREQYYIDLLKPQYNIRKIVYKENLNNKC